MVPFVKYSHRLFSYDMSHAVYRNLHNIHRQYLATVAGHKKHYCELKQIKRGYR